MKSCIFTVIKNEHEYLDEWIKYHLDLGINHIFIFEDVDSKSHKDIIDKYGDKVTLNNVLTAFNDEQIDIIKKVKKERKKTPQNSYIVNGLIYIQNTYPNTYDWCFVIDNDEFITLEDENSNLDDILKIYDSYDAFMLQWKCFGANMLIYKPNYDEKGLIDTYTEPAKGQMNHEAIWFTKTCYNLRTFKKEHFWHLHQPSDACKWCKSDLRHYRLRPIYKNIYIRHYITRSWEEYVWKMSTRGYMGINTRNYDIFFQINPDMEDRREELMEIANNILNYDKK